jgi:hypothetical protein
LHLVEKLLHLCHPGRRRDPDAIHNSHNATIKNNSQTIKTSSLFLYFIIGHSMLGVGYLNQLSPGGTFKRNAMELVGALRRGRY